MRQIVLDTETTGLEATQGHRIIEIGCVEIVNRRITPRQYQQYVNPEREIDAGAAEVHGMTLNDLRERPLFADVVTDFIEFIRGAELIIHNAAFDVGFIDAELARLGPAWGTTADYCTVFDTLGLARQLHPGQRNSLDALCRRYEIDNAHRALHGALLDAELLAEVYLAMTGGQVILALDSDTGDSARAQRRVAADKLLTRDFKVITPDAAALAAHQATLDRLDLSSDGHCVWARDSGPAAQ